MRARLIVWLRQVCLLVLGALVLSTSSGFSAAVSARTAVEAASPVPLELHARILRLEDERRWGAVLLVTLLDDPREAARDLAARALGRIGDPSAVGALARRLRNEPVPAIRGQLAHSLGLLGDPRSLRSLVEVMSGDPDLEVRIRCAQALGSIPHRLSLLALIAALPPSNRIVTGPAEQLVWQLAASLVKLADARAVDALATLASSPSASVRSAVAWALARLKQPGSEEVLRRLAADPEPTVACWALRGLAFLEKPGGITAQTALRSSSDIVRVFAAASLGFDDSPASIEALTAALGTESDDGMRGEVATAMGSAMGRALGSDPGRVRSVEMNRALGVLASVRVQPGAGGRAADQALARISAALDRPTPGSMSSGLGPDPFFEGVDDDVRPPISPPHSVIDGLGWIQALSLRGGPRSHRALSRIATGASLITDPGRVLVTAAVAALAERANRVTAASLGFHTGDRDPYVRAATVDALVKSGRARDHRTLRESYLRASSEVVDEFRVTAARSSVGHDSSELRALLSEARADRERVIRVVARDALARTSGDRRMDPGPQAARRSDAFYREAAALARTRPSLEIVTERGSFRIALRPDVAPLTVHNILTLARGGFFDGRAIPRVAEQFVVQMGDPRGDLSGGPGYTIRCELNTLRYERGRVGMALSGRDTGGCQFFVMLGRHPHLDSAYTVFGEVESGMDVVDRIQKGDRILSVKVRP